MTGGEALDWKSTLDQSLQAIADYARIAAEALLSACAWLELELITYGLDPLLVPWLAGVTFVAWLSWTLNKRRILNQVRYRRPLRRVGNWLLVSPFYLFAGYILADEILYRMPYEYTERLYQFTGVERTYPDERTGDQTAASNFTYPRAVSAMAVRRYAVHVIDADTLRLAGTKIRLNGIAAPEHGHPAYRKGKIFVRRLLRQSESITCNLMGEQTHDREVGYCFAIMDGKKVDIQAEVVSAGLARDCRRYSGGRYRRLEGGEARGLPLPGYCG